MRGMKVRERDTQQRCATAKKKARPEEDEPREDRQLCRERCRLLLVHACITPTRQAMMMVHVIARAFGEHLRKVLDSPTQVNRAARRMHRASRVLLGVLTGKNCAEGCL